MDVLLPNYLEENIVEGENVPILQVQVHQKYIIKCLPNPTRFLTETVPEPVPFKYSAQYIENDSYNRYSKKYGKTGCFFQDHHTL